MIDGLSRYRPRFDLLRTPVLGRFLLWKHSRTAMQIPLFLLAAIMIVDGLVGSRLAAKNMATVGAWVHYRGLVVVALLLAGNLFCAGCPFLLPRKLARWLGRPSMRWPKALRNKWGAIAGLIAILWIYEVWDLWASPWLTAWVAIAYFAAAFVIEALFSRDSFCMYVCPLGTFNFLYSTASPLQITNRSLDVCRSCVGKDCINGRYEFVDENEILLQQGCQLELFVPTIQSNMNCTLCLDCAKACPHDNVALIPRRPGDELFRQTWPKRMDLALLAIFAAAAGMVNAFAMTPPVYEPGSVAGRCAQHQKRGVGPGAGLRRRGDSAPPGTGLHRGGAGTHPGSRRGSATQPDHHGLCLCLRAPGPGHLDRPLSLPLLDRGLHHRARPATVLRPHTGRGPAGPTQLADRRGPDPQRGGSPDHPSHRHAGRHRLGPGRGVDRGQSPAVGHPIRPGRGPALAADHPDSWGHQPGHLQPAYGDAGQRVGLSPIARSHAPRGNALDAPASPGAERRQPFPRGAWEREPSIYHKQKEHKPMKPSRMTKILTLLILLSLALTACNLTPTAAPAMNDGMGTDMSAMLTGDALRVENPMSRPSPLVAGTGAAYMMIVNPTEMADRLVAVSSPAAKVGEIHETVNDDGVMRMIPQPDGFEIPAKSVLELKPGGKHLMLIDLVAPLEIGQEIELTLTFEQAGEMVITVPVMDMAGMPAMDMGK